MRRTFILLLGFWLAITISYSQNLPDNAAYKARMDSLNTVAGAIMNDWNKTIPPHFIKAMRLEKEAKEHPELKDSLLAIAAMENGADNVKAKADYVTGRPEQAGITQALKHFGLI